eukprot:1139263-Pelagomonas_calceolata.AAC.4
MCAIHTCAQNAGCWTLSCRLLLQAYTQEPLREHVTAPAKACACNGARGIHNCVPRSKSAWYPPCKGVRKGVHLQWYVQRCARCVYSSCAQHADWWTPKAATCRHRSTSRNTHTDASTEHTGALPVKQEKFCEGTRLPQSAQQAPVQQALQQLPPPPAHTLTHIPLPILFKQKQGRPHKFTLQAPLPHKCTESYAFAHTDALPAGEVPRGPKAASVSPAGSCVAGPAAAAGSTGSSGTRGVPKAFLGRPAHDSV